jgi:tRNA pseudouridine38-40 synthase
VEVGKERLKTTEVKKILMARNRKLAGPTAPAYGLYLEKIKFAGK